MHLEAAFLGIVAGWLRGGKILQLAELTLPGWPLAVLAVLMQLLIKVSFHYHWGYIFAAAPYLHIISFGPLLYFVYLNRNRRGMLLVGLGLLLNLIAIAANGGLMPVNLTGMVLPLQERLQDGGSPLHTVMTEDTVFPFLGDQIRLTLGSTRIISIGDILLALGIAFLIQRYMVAAPGSSTRRKAAKK